MTFVTLSKLSVGDPLKKSFLDGLVDNVNDLDGRIGTSSGSGIPNGSFETESAGQASNWTQGGSEQGSVDSSDQGVGGKSYKMSWSGAIAATTLTSDLFPVSDASVYSIGYLYKSSSTTNTIKVDVRYYLADAATTTGGLDTLFSSSSGLGTSWTANLYKLSIASNARYAQLILTADDNGSAGSISWDGFELQRAHIYPAQVGRTQLSTAAISWTPTIGANSKASASHANAGWTLGASCKIQTGQSGWYILGHGSDSVTQDEYMFAYNDSSNTAGQVDISWKYIQSSPPYDFGDGEVGAIAYALVNNSGKVIDTLIANDPPWPVPKAEFYVSNRPHYRRVIEESPRATPLERLQQLTERPRELTEITSKSKTEAWARTPHPWRGQHIPGAHVVMIDPVSKEAHLIREVLATGEVEAASEVSAMILKYGFDNSPLTRRMPPGVPAHRLKV